MSRLDRTDRLSQALQGLEGAPVSEGFTARVLSGLEARDARRRRRRNLGALVATAGLALLVGAGALLLRQPEARMAETATHPAPPAGDRTGDRTAEAILREHRRLVQELDRLRALADETSPVLYLGRSRDYDLVLDLEPLLLADGGEGSYRPARYEGERRQP